MRNGLFHPVALLARIVAAGVLAASPGCGRGRQQARVTYIRTQKEATRTIDEVGRSRRPSILVISAEWCSFCRELERAILKYADGSRRVYISLADPGQSGLIDHVNEVFGNVMTAHMIPSTIITQYLGTVVFTQGYDPAREQFDGGVRLDGTPTGPIPIRSLFTEERHGSDN
ncbi:MAG: hypothetical protein GXP47_05145 [Acidobacteria bacterium]|nr:hypothetical protein [Acidobacteriota bacterium]